MAAPLWVSLVALIMEGLDEVLESEAAEVEDIVEILQKKMMDSEMQQTNDWRKGRKKALMVLYPRGPTY